MEYAGRYLLPEKFSAGTFMVPGVLDARGVAEFCPGLRLTSRGLHGAKFWIQKLEGGGDGVSDWSYLLKLTELLAGT